MSQKKILLTGGGTAGHVTPNIALIPLLREAGYEIHYIGSYDGIEKNLIEAQNIPYTGISSGKLRRYFSLKNFSDPFRILKGFDEAKKFIKSYKPDILFSKGGFVSVPVVFAAHRYHIPVIIHESDMTPGLANKLSIPKAVKVCHNFPETSDYLPSDKSVLSGCPIRKELFSGNRFKGLDLCGFTANKPVIMVMGGSLGASSINEAVRKSIASLTRNYQIIHLCGKGKLDPSLEAVPSYKQFEYADDELRDLFAACDIIISRAGANAICEFLALKKPGILIPLPSSSSRGDQLLNAASFEKRGFAKVLYEENLTPDALVAAVEETFANRGNYMEAMNVSDFSSAAEIIVNLIKKYSN